MMNFGTTLQGKRICSLQKQLEIVPADISAWRSLSEYHYRAGRPGAIDKIFALRVVHMKYSERENIRAYGRGGRDRPAGVIVYSMPLPNVALRNRATNNRYLGLGDRCRGLQLLNREMRWISRVVIHPQYRGIGLARYLVEQTLERAQTIMVEALAAMGRVNPFFERAGMKRYEQAASARALRLIEAFGQVGIGEEQLYDPGALSKAIDNLAPEEQTFINKEMMRFTQPFRGRRHYINGQDKNRKGDLLVRLAVQHVMIKPIYYLWRAGG